jgi:hypothetical protein
MVINYTNISQCKTLQNLTDLVFLKVCHLASLPIIIDSIAKSFLWNAGAYPTIVSYNTSAVIGNE